MKKKILVPIIFFLILGMSNIIYSIYILNRQFNVGISTAPFYFDTENNVETEFYGENAKLDLKIVNNDGNNYNTFDTNYQISLADNSKFSILEEDINNGKIEGGSIKSNTVNLKFLPVQNYELKFKEQIDLLITSTKPYKKQIKESIIINNAFIKVGKITGGKSGTIDCTKISNYKELTAEDFLLDIEQIVVPEEAYGTMNFTKTYNANTGILTISRDSITGNGVITFTGTIYATSGTRAVASGSGGYNIDINCTQAKDWGNKNVNNFVTDLKWVTIPAEAIGTMDFSKTYDQSTGIIHVNRTSIKGEGIIIFLVDVYST